MRDVFDPIDVAEARMAERVRDWLEQAVVPIDAGAIAREAAAPHGHARSWPGANTFMTRSMFTVLGATAAAILALAVGGLLLVAGQAPPNDPAARPSVSATPAPGTAVEFSGSFRPSACPGGDIDTTSGAHVRGAVCALEILEMSDPRLLGEGEVRVDRDGYAGGRALSWAAHRIENDDGAWQEVPGVYLWEPDRGASTRTITLLGEGGFSGLTVVAELSSVERGWELHGYILAGDPPMPEPSAAPADG